MVVSVRVSWCCLSLCLLPCLSLCRGSSMSHIMPCCVVHAQQQEERTSEQEENNIRNTTERLVFIWLSRGVKKLTKLHIAHDFPYTLMCTQSASSPYIHPWHKTHLDHCLKAYSCTWIHTCSISPDRLMIHFFYSHPIRDTRSPYYNTMGYNGIWWDGIWWHGIGSECPCRQRSISAPWTRCHYFEMSSMPHYDIVLECI